MNTILTFITTLAGLRTAQPAPAGSPLESAIGVINSTGQTARTILAGITGNRLQTVDRMLMHAEELEFEAGCGSWSAAKQLETVAMLRAAAVELRRLQAGASDNPIMLPRHTESGLKWLLRIGRADLDAYYEAAPTAPTLQGEAMSGTLEAISDALPQEK